MSVGYKLYRLVRDFAPQDWTSGELLVAWVIADAANDTTLRAYIDTGELAARARMSQRTVRDNLQKLSVKGFEFRVPVGLDKHGNDLYGIPGKPAEYQVPGIFRRLARGAAVAHGLVDNLPEGGTGVPPWPGLSTGEGGTGVPPRWHRSATFRVRAPFAFDLKTISKPPQPVVLVRTYLSWNRAHAREETTCGKPARWLRQQIR